MKELLLVVMFFVVWWATWKGLYRHGIAQGKHGRVVWHLVGCGSGFIAGMVLLIAALPAEPGQAPGWIAILLAGLVTVGLVKLAGREPGGKVIPVQASVEAGEEDDYEEPLAASAAHGKVRFVYRDASGIESIREVDITRRDREYFTGHCHLANELQTFRYDHVLAVLEGEELLQVARPARRMTGYVGAPKPSDQVEVFFEGFTGIRKEWLEGVANAAGMKVRRNVSRNLTYLVGGPNAGPSKVEKAAGQGVIVLTEDEFLRMLDTGELPDTL